MILLAPAMIFMFCEWYAYAVGYECRFCMYAGVCVLRCDSVSVFAVMVAIVFGVGEYTCKIGIRACAISSSYLYCFSVHAQWCVVLLVDKKFCYSQPTETGRVSLRLYDKLPLLLHSVDHCITYPHSGLHRSQRCRYSSVNPQSHNQVRKRSVHHGWYVHHPHRYGHDPHHDPRSSQPLTNGRIYGGRRESLLYLDSYLVQNTPSAS